MEGQEKTTQAQLPVWSVEANWKPPADTTLKLDMGQIAAAFEAVQKIDPKTSQVVSFRHGFEVYEALAILPEGSLLLREQDEISPEPEGENAIIRTVAYSSLWIQDNKVDPVAEVISYDRDDTSVDRFKLIERGLEAVKKIDSPYLMKPIGGPWKVWEPVTGDKEEALVTARPLAWGDLFTWIEETSPTLTQAYGPLSHAMRGLQAMHTGKVLHRDFKPENILVTKKGDQGFLGDFEFAIDKSAVTPEEEPCGTPGYTPMNVIVGIEPYDFPSDAHTVGKSILTLIDLVQEYGTVDDCDLLEKLQGIAENLTLRQPRSRLTVTDALEQLSKE